MPGPANYATTSDLSEYLPLVVETEQDAIWTTFLSVASRAIDRFCDRFFYDEGALTRYFDGDGSNRLDIPGRDLRTVTTLQVLWTEGTDFTGDHFITFNGDGINPPSNFWLEPNNPGFAGKAGDASLRPYTRIVIPETLLQGTTGWLPVFTRGRRTVKVVGDWGWPVIPDEIRDITVKVVVRMWKAKEAGWTGAVGDPTFGGAMVIQNYLDVNDLHTLESYSRRKVVF